MKGHIPENILDDILSKIDIVEVISGLIPLKKAGRNFKALCPFHHEKTASFMVSPDRQIYHCFGCGESGNAFKFLMSYERLEFPEAVEILAKKAGVILPEPRRQEEKSANFLSEVYRINELAASFYENNLSIPQAAKARDYLSRRAINSETIKLFRIGFAPDRWDALLNFLRSKSINLSLIEKAGLLVSKEGGGYYDRFRNRVIFPIIDIKGRITAFAARVLDDSLPKYINSPETPVYVKGSNLYGLNLARDAIREKGYAVIVEGYLDLITPFTAGLKNIVASQGTALTAGQSKLLKRYSENVVVIFDADLAGELAALRSLEIFIEEGMQVKVVSLPKGFDPDSFVRKYSLGHLLVEIEKADSLFDYKLKVLKSRYNAKDIEGKARICALMLETISKFKNAILKSEFVRKLACELDVREEALFQELSQIKQEKPDSYFAPALVKKMPEINATEKLLIKLMLEEKEMIETIKQNLEPADFQDERVSRIVSIMFNLIEQGKDIEPNILMNHFNEEEMSRVLSESAFLPQVSEQNRQRVLDDCIHRLKENKTRQKRQHLHEQIKLAQNLGDEEKLRNLIKEFHFLIRKGQE